LQIIPVDPLQNNRLVDPMKTSNFSYELPDSAVAIEPIEPRDSARLLISRSEDEVIDEQISNIAQYLEPGDLLIVNNTKVLPARIPVVRSTGGSGEIFLLHRIDDGLWNALVKPSKKIDDGEKVTAKADNKEFTIEVSQDNGEGHRVVRFVDANEQEVLAAVGKTPLPPYMGKVDIPLERYQTMFAKTDKSVAAPTAGLHFTQAVKDSLTSKSIEIEEVTLHVGVGTFRPITKDDIEDHIMHSEEYEVLPEVWGKIQETKKRGNNVIAVGTTSLRTLESAAKYSKLSGDTELYCHGDFPFQVVDMLLTNYHQPQSSLLVLLDSFIGSRWKDLYNHALNNKYRFLSFGDAMLVSRKNNI